MAALHAASAAGAMSDLNIETPHDGLPHDVFLELGLSFIVDRWRARVLRLRGQRHGNLVVHPLRNRPAGALAVIGPTLPSRWFGFLLFLSASGEWRGLTLQGSQRFLKLFAQSLDLGLRVLQLIAKCLNLSG